MHSSDTGSYWREYCLSSCIKVSAKSRLLSLSEFIKVQIEVKD